MREGCWDCMMKHMAQADVLDMESVLGYPEHRGRVIGHMAEASEEGFKKWPEWAQAARQHRIRMMEDPLYHAPFMAFYNLAQTGKVCEAANQPLPALPAELDEALTAAPK